MNKSTEGFSMLWVIGATLPMCLATPGEVLHLVANHKDYKAALLIFSIGLLSFILGSWAFGTLRRQLKELLRDNYNVTRKDKK